MTRNIHRSGLLMLITFQSKHCLYRVYVAGTQLITMLYMLNKQYLNKR